MFYQVFSKLFSINPTKVIVAVFLALLLMSLLVPEVAFANNAPSPGSTGG